MIEIQDLSNCSLEIRHIIFQNYFSLCTGVTNNYAIGYSNDKTLKYYGFIKDYLELFSPLFKRIKIFGETNYNINQISFEGLSDKGKSLVEDLWENNRLPADYKLWFNAHFKLPKVNFNEIVKTAPIMKQHKIEVPDRIDLPSSDDEFIFPDSISYLYQEYILKENDEEGNYVLWHSPSCKLEDLKSIGCLNTFIPYFSDIKATCFLYNDEWWAKCFILSSPVPDYLKLYKETILNKNNVIFRFI